MNKTETNIINFEFKEEIHLQTLKSLYINEEKYQKKRFDIFKEELENIVIVKYDNFRDWVDSQEIKKDLLDKNLSNIEKKYNKKINYWKDKFYKNKIKEKEFKSKVNLLHEQKKQISNNIAKKNNEKFKLIDENILKKKKEISLKIKIFKEKNEIKIKKFQKNILKKLNTFKNNLEKISKNEALFYDGRKTLLDKKLSDLNNKFKNLNTNLDEKINLHLISESLYEKEKNNLLKKYNLMIKKIHKDTNRHTKNVRKELFKNKLQILYEKDRLLRKKDSLFKSLNKSKIIIFFFFLAIITGILNPNFFSGFNIFTAILRNNVFIGFIAIGETFVILTGGIDLSVGSLIGFGGVMYMLFTVTFGMNVFLALILMIIIVTMLGIFFGTMVSRFNVPPFIITLAGLLSLRGAIAIILGGVPISNGADPIFAFLSSKVGQIPWLVIIFFLLAIITIVFVKFSKWGRYVYATGDNREAARLSGINTKMILTSVYGVSAMFASFGALAAISTVTSVSPATGQFFELDAITAVVLGGTSVNGGEGGVGKTLIGWFVLALLINVFVFYQVDSNVQFVAKGAIIVVAVLLDREYNMRDKIKKFYFKTISRF